LKKSCGDAYTADFFENLAGAANKQPCAAVIAGTAAAVAEHRGRLDRLAFAIETTLGRASNEIRLCRCRGFRAHCRGKSFAGAGGRAKAFRRERLARDELAFDDPLFGCGHWIFVR
jgi:hypothetical protein